MTTKVRALIAGVAVVLCAVSCKHSPNPGSELAQVSTPVDPNNQDSMGNALAQAFADIYAKHNGNIAEAIKAIQTDDQMGQAAKKQLLAYMQKMGRATNGDKLKVEFVLNAQDADKELQFISNIVADTKFKENADLVKFVKDNKPIFCAYELAPNGWDIERTCIDVTRIAAEIFGAVKSGAFFTDANIMDSIKARVVYKELVDFDKYGKAWEDKSPDQVYAWSKERLATLPIENSSIRLVGEAIALRNAWIKAMVNGDEATAIKYEDKMRDLKNHSADEKRVLEYSNVENKESVVKRLIRIFNLSENELKQRVNNYNESQKPWWVFW
jgi:hypothetical protein